MKVKLLVAGVLLVAIGLGGWWLMLSEDSPVSNVLAPSNDAEQAQETNDNIIRITAVGDLLPHETVNARAFDGNNYNYTQFFNNVQDFFDGDINFCNQESPSGGEEFSISGYPSFNAPKKFSRDIQTVGCNVINLANNHIADRGQEVIDATLQTWQELGPLAVSGASSSLEEKNQPAYFEVKGKKFAFIAFTDLSNNNDLFNYSVNLFTPELVETLAREAAENADFVIASAHWGTEDSNEINAGQRQWAQLLANNGVDLIIGTGPHVLQPVEKVTTEDGREVSVWYSLGNFLSTQLKIDQLIGGMAIIDLDISGDEIVISNQGFRPTYMHFEWTVQESAVEDLLARKNLALYPLQEAADPLARSLFGTTVETELEKVRAIVQNDFVSILDPN